ncbi:DUF4245 domain-containing protein [Streptomyces sp. NPDC026673]|uniref:DUF4245 domain-containing protein n=1 Tax=Streptomyces sp. NPDC026673 TaxID=3155724 RepID=UPI0033D4C3EF
MAKKRGTETLRDMVLSLAAIGVVAAVIWLFIPHDENHDPVKAVGYRVELDQARRDAPYQVAAPEGLGKEWRATSVTYQAADPKAVRWHLGFVDPANEYAAVEQSNEAAEKFVAKMSHEAERVGTRTVGGETWQRYEGPKYDALVREEGGVTTMVTGTAPMARLAELAAALEARGGGQG